ncbi:hypothetical protein ACHAXT_010161 [Thalassiosira profunda]
MSASDATGGGASAPSMPPSPFFRPSNLRVSTVTTPNGTRTAVVAKKRAGKEAADEGVPFRDAETKSSLLGACANLCTVTIGAGIVGLPYAVKEAGLVAGTVMIIVCALLTDYSLRMVITTGKFANVNSYETLLEATFGRAGFLFVSISMFFLSYGSMVAYLTIIKDVLPVLFGVTAQEVDAKRFVMFVSSLLVILPLSLQRDMANLERTSSLNVLFNLCLVALVVGFAPVRESVSDQGGILQMIADEPLLEIKTFFVGFGVCSFAFVCQDSSFIIAGSMRTPSKSRWRMVVHGAMLTCCALELTIGVAGYLAYQGNTRGNILNNMSSEHWSGVVSRAMLSTTMFCAYPMNLYIARHAFIVVFFKGTMAHEGDDSTVLTRRDRRVVLTFALYVLSLVPAILMESTGKVLAVTGAIGGSSLAYIVPGLSFIAVHSSEFIRLVHRRWNANASSHLWGYPMREFGIEECSTTQHLDIIAEDGRPLYQSDDSSRVTKLDVFLWYILGMPIWSSVAWVGQMNLADHYEREDLASPGVVRPKRVTLLTPKSHPVVLTDVHASSNSQTASQDEGHEQTSLLESKRRGSKYGTNSPNVNLLQRSSSITSVELNEELKNEVPTWTDFHIATSYVVLGVVAMIWGLASILLM